MRILVFAASLRKESLNKKLAVLISQKLEASGVEVDHADFRDFQMPVYDGDIETSDGIPAGTRRLADSILGADSVVIVSPEYNFGVPGPLKNAVDWLSRIRPYPMPPERSIRQHAAATFPPRASIAAMHSRDDTSRWSIRRHRLLRLLQNKGIIHQGKGLGGDIRHGTPSLRTKRPGLIECLRH